MPSSAADFLDHLKLLHGVKTDTDLAAKLGSSKAAIANWRRRDAVPASVRLQAQAHFGGRAIANTAHGQRLEDTAFAVALRVYDKEGRRWTTQDPIARLELWGFIFTDVLAAVTAHISDRLADVPGGRLLLEQCLSDLESGKIEGIEKALTPHRR